MMRARSYRTALLLLGIVALLSAHVAQAGMPEAVQLFDEGNEHYAVGNYESAVEAYQAAIGEGYVSAALFFNLGNAHYRRDELGEAVRAYERARLLAPDDPEILHNLSIVEDRTVDQFSRLPAPYWLRGWEWVVRAVGVWGFFAIGIVCWFAATAAIVRRTVMGSTRVWLRRATSVLLVLGISSLTLAFAASLDRQARRSAVVVASEVPLRSEPSSTAGSEITIHEGLVVDVLREQESWALLRLPNGVQGWSPENVIEEIAIDVP